MNKKQLLEEIKDCIDVIDEYGEAAEASDLLVIFHSFARLQKTDKIFLLKDCLNNNVFSKSIDDAVAILKILFPNWGYRLCHCYLSNDAFIFPDVNDPEHAEKLDEEYGHIIIDWEDATDVELNAKNSTLAKALCFSMFKAIKIIVGVEREAQ